MSVRALAIYLGVGYDCAKRMTLEDDFPKGIRIHRGSPLSWWKSDLDAWIVSRGIRLSSKEED